MERYILKTLYTLVALLLAGISLQAQSSTSQELQPLIKLINGSFEDTPSVGRKYGKGPDGWRDCGMQDETAPDIHPAPAGMEPFFEVSLQPSQGNTYVGMVVRENVTWEGIAQRLRSPLMKGKCYNFSIDLARAKRYVSSSKKSPIPVNYKKAAVLRIWGSNSACRKLELLDETDAVENHQWMTYNMRLEPSRNYAFLMLEVFYKTPVFTEYNGNMLLDNASDLMPVPCDEAPEPSVETPDTELIASTNPINTSPNKTNKEPNNKPRTEQLAKEENPKSSGKPAKKKKEYLKELNDDIKVGQEITLKNLYFDADSSSIQKRYYPIVNDVYSYLLENEKVIIEVGGHTNNRCEDMFCNKLSEKRAKAIANYLTKKGIRSNRVKYKGYGKTNPKYPNNTPTNRRRNQRVEIKILSKG
ncbi:MAG: OmpA family protein [Saprospiraceae bacterium]